MSKTFPLNRIATALVDAMLPAGADTPMVDSPALLARINQHLDAHPTLRPLLMSGLLWLENRAILSTGKRFSRLTPEQRDTFLNQLSQSPVSGKLLRALSLPFKTHYLLNQQVQQALGSRLEVQVPAQIEQFRWQQQICKAADFEDDETIEADVIVIGSGAGGAAAAYQLASKGLAVVIIEEGSYYNRLDFNGKLTEVIPKLYRASGATVSTGNVTIPIPVGKCVGGTTTINSGTCMRTPDTVLENWRNRGLTSFTPEAMAPWFREVEEILAIEQASPEYVGEIGNVIEQGARALGFTRTGPLMRNAKGCDGQGLCQFGCPTDAKQSTNVSYIPRALERGAFLFTELKATRLQHNHQRISGVTTVGQNAHGKKITLNFQARHVIVSMGSFYTPGFLQSNGVKNPNLGKHLTIHPAGAVNAWFPGLDFKNSQTIPQGYGVHDLASEGLVFEGGTVPLAGFGLLNNSYGRAFVDMTERYQQTAWFGFMVQDTSEGRVYSTPGRKLPLIRYHMNDRDFATFLRGIRVLGEIYFAAGAKEVYIPGPNRIETLRSLDELYRFVNDAKRKPADFLMTAYHPLGTARIAANPYDGVCDEQHQVFGWEGLYVMDGSAVPSSLGANPQVTIMSLASKAADRLALKISEQEHHVHFSSGDKRTASGG